MTSTNYFSLINVRAYYFDAGVIVLLLGCLILPEKKSLEKDFEIAHRGALNENDMLDLTHKIINVLQGMRIKMPLEEVAY